MKRLIFIVIIGLFSEGLIGQIKFGGGIETNFDVTGIKGMVSIGIAEEWSGQVSYAFFLNQSNPSMLNFDAHYLLTTAGDHDAIKVHGIGGLNYWKSGVPGVSSELGVNIGANITFPISDRLDMFIEPKFTLINVGDFFIAVGVYF